CEKCFTVYHNKCIYDWIFKLNSQTTHSALEKYKWSCPHCNNQTEATSESLPEYNCYCKKYFEAEKTKNPQFNPGLIPHGCGMECGKEICKHIKKCLLPCHPGPHISCNVIERTTCFCT